MFWTEAEAITAWNTRHRTPDIEGVRIGDVVYDIMQDVCELPGDVDIGADDTLVVGCGDLRIVLERNLEAAFTSLTRPTDDADRLLRWIQPAMHVLRGMLRVADLKLGRAKAEEMCAAIDAHLSGNAAQADTGNAALVEAYAKLRRLAVECLTAHPDRERTRRLYALPQSLAALSNEGKRDA